MAGLASTRTYPLRSSFRPSYNMAVNLVGQVGRRPGPRRCCESSFAQFQADRAVVGLARQVRRNEEALEGYREAMTCHLGDFEEYAGLRRAHRRPRGGAVAQRRGQPAGGRRPPSLEELRPGDVIRVPAGRRAGLAVVLDPGADGGADGPRPTVLTAERQVRRLSLADFPAPVEPLRPAADPEDLQPAQPAARRDLASTLRNTGSADAPAGPGPPRRAAAAADDAELARAAGRDLRAHPCHGCAEREDHARWAERYHRLPRETDAAASAGSRAARTRSPAPSTGSARCSSELGYLRRRRR